MQGCTKASSSIESAAETGAAFTDVTQSAGLGDFRHETGAFGQKWMPESLGAGGGFIDYNGDRRLDVVLVAGAVWPERGAPIPALELYRNEGDGTFSRVTMEAGLGSVSAYGFGIAAADYDGDGDEDVFLTTLAENMLFRNDDGIFTEVAQEAGLAEHSEWSTAAMFFDADADGLLDLYVGNYVPWSPENDKWCTSDGVTKDYCTPHQYDGIPGRFFRNTGSGSFEERTAEAGFGGSPGKTLGVVSMDFDVDGRVDVFVANDTERNLLYHNEGGGRFREIGVAAGVAYDVNGRARAGMGVDAAVLQGTRTSIAVGNFSEEMVALFTYTGNDLFVDRAAAAGLGMASMQPLTFGLFFFDANLDGFLDLLLANGHIIEHIETLQPSLTYRQRAQLFLGRRDGTFEAGVVQEDGALAQKLVARGAAHGDYDGDGDLDVLITENGGGVYLWRNELNPASRDSAHSLRVHLEGIPPNLEALGARVIAVAGGRRQERWVRSGGSYLSQSEKTLTFGFGSEVEVDSLLIYWPSGRVDVLEHVKADQTLRLIEGQAIPDGNADPESV